MEARDALDSEDIDGGEEQHEQARYYLRPAEGEFPIAGAEKDARVFEMQGGEKLR